jgi:energy-coupling factor transporter ATP-binding protein EcfA2
MAKATLRSSDEALFPLEEKVEEFLKSKQEVMLILGDSGSGKSTFGRYLEQKLWKEYRERGTIPLFISLPSITNPQENMIAKQLEIVGFTTEQVWELRKNRRFILICDGYDESQRGVNLYSTNRLNEDGQWCAKMIISCRSQHVPQDYKGWFEPQQERYKSVVNKDLDLFQEAVIAPFSRAEIRNYVDQYVRSNDDHFLANKPSNWTTDDYIDKLHVFRDLMTLVSNPFLLGLALVALPDLVTAKEEYGNASVSRIQLYDIFAEKWLICALERLRRSALSNEEREELENLAGDFVAMGTEYLMELSTAIFDKQAGNPVVAFDWRKDKESWQNKFFGSMQVTRWFRMSTPLIHVGKNTHRFLHRSLLEYFYSRTFFGPNADTDSDDDKLTTFDKVRKSIAHHPLRQKNILDQPSVIQFLAERAQMDVAFKQQLLAMIESLEVDPQSAHAAVQAVEILTVARIRFNGFNLSGVRVQNWS